MQMSWMIWEKVRDELKVSYPHAHIWTSTMRFLLLPVQIPICVLFLSKCRSLFPGACGHLHLDNPLKSNLSQREPNILLPKAGASASCLPCSRTLCFTDLGQFWGLSPEPPGGCSISVYWRALLWHGFVPGLRQNQPVHWLTSPNKLPWIRENHKMGAAGEKHRRDSSTSIFVLFIVRAHSWESFKFPQGRKRDIDTSCFETSACHPRSLSWNKSKDFTLARLHDIWPVSSDGF